MSKKKYEIMMNIDHLEGTIDYLRNNEVYCATPEEISNVIDILEGIKTRLQDRI